METASPAYRITTQNGTVIADNLPRSAPVIQLHEGTLSKGDKPPKELASGESSIVSYPLIDGRLICRVARIDGIETKDIDPKLIEFVEPDPMPKKVETDAQPVKVRRGRGKKS